MIANAAQYLFVSTRRRSILRSYSGSATERKSVFGLYSKDGSAWSHAKYLAIRNNCRNATQLKGRITITAKTINEEMLKSTWENWKSAWTHLIETTSFQVRYNSFLSSSFLSGFTHSLLNLQLVCIFILWISKYQLLKLCLHYEKLRSGPARTHKAS